MSGSHIRRHFYSHSHIYVRKQVVKGEARKHQQGMGSVSGDDIQPTTHLLTWLQKAKIETRSAKRPWHEMQSAQKLVKPSSATNQESILQLTFGRFGCFSLVPLVFFCWNNVFKASVGEAPWGCGHRPLADPCLATAPAGTSGVLSSEHTALHCAQQAPLALAPSPASIAKGLQPLERPCVVSMLLRAHNT